MGTQRKIRKEKDKLEKKEEEDKEFELSISRSFLLGRIKAYSTQIKSTSGTISKLFNITKSSNDRSMLKSFIRLLEVNASDIETVLKTLVEIGEYDIKEVLTNDPEVTQKLAKIDLELDRIETVLTEINVNIFEKFAVNITVKEKEIINTIKAGTETIKSIVDSKE